MGDLGAFVGVAVVVLTLAGRAATNGSRRALLLGLATGTLYGLTAVLTKSTVDLFGHGILQTFTHWQPWALAVCSVAGLVLNQSAFQAGHVAASLPAISVVNPVVACVLGVALFNEDLGASTPIEWAVTVVSIVVMIVGTIRLSTSPLVTREAQSTHHAILP